MKKRQPSRVRSEHERRRGDGGSRSRRHVYCEVVKTFILFFVFFLISSVGYSAPNYDKNNVTTEWDSSENISLLNKLEKEYDKRHTVDEEHMNGGPEAYYREVLVPYIKQSKNMKELPQKKYTIEK